LKLSAFSSGVFLTNYFKIQDNPKKLLELKHCFYLNYGKNANKRDKGEKHDEDSHTHHHGNNKNINMNSNLFLIKPTMVSYISYYPYLFKIKFNSNSIRSYSEYKIKKLNFLPIKFKEISFAMNFNVKIKL
jgi:hypothetical protein